MRSSIALTEAVKSGQLVQGKGILSFSKRELLTQTVRKIPVTPLISLSSSPWIGSRDVSLE
jgi:hypothetical protein